METRKSKRPIKLIAKTTKGRDGELLFRVERYCTDEGFDDLCAVVETDNRNKFEAWMKSTLTERPDSELIDLESLWKGQLI